MGTNDNDKDRLDRWLDGALQQYGNSEPRAGLERRILANLETAADNRTIGGRGWWAFATAALMVCIAVAVWVGSDTNRAPKKFGRENDSRSEFGGDHETVEAPFRLWSKLQHLRRITREDVSRRRGSKQPQSRGWSSSRLQDR